MSSELAVGVVIGASLRAGFATVLGRAKKTVHEIGSEIQVVSRKQESLGRILAKGVASGRSGLGVLRERYDVLGRSIDKAASAQNRLNKAIKLQESGKINRQNLRSEMADTLGHGAVVAGPVVASVKKFMEQESASADLKIAMMRKDGTFGRFTEIDRLTTEWGAALPGNKTDFSKMALGLKSQGISDETIINGGGLATAQLNVVMDIPIADGSFFAKNMEAHGIKESELLRSADLNQRAYFAAGLKKEDMFEAMKYYAGKANTLGFTGLDHQKKLYAVEGMAATKGIEGSQFGTNFSTFLTNLSKGPENLEYAGRGRRSELQKMAKSVGAEFKFFNADGSIKDLREITSVLESEFAKVKAKYGEKGVMDLSQAMFGSEGGRIADILIQSGVSGFDAMIAKMDQQASLSDRIKVKTGTLSAALEALGGAAENAAAIFGSVFGEDIKGFAITVQGFLENTLQPFLQENKTTIKWLVSLAAGFFLGKLAILGFMYSLSMVAMPFKALWLAGNKAYATFRLFQLLRVGRIGKSVVMFRMLGLSASSAAKAVKVLGAVFSFAKGGLLALAANPVILAFGLLAAAAYLLYRNWSDVVGGAKALWQDLGSFFGGITSAIVNFFRLAWEQIKAFFSSGILNISATIINWSPIGLFYQAFAAVMGWFGVTLPAKFTEFGSNIMTGLWNGLKAKFEAVKAWFSGAASWFSSKFQTVNQIHSPSRLFKRFGGWMMEGLQIGLDAGSHRPLTAIGGAANQMRDRFAERMGNLRANVAARLDSAGSAFSAERGHMAADGAVTIHYNPTINVQGGDVAGFQEALRMSQRDFEEMFRRMMADNARRAY